MKNIPRNFEFYKVFLNCICRVNYNNIHEFLNKQCKTDTAHYATQLLIYKIYDFNNPQEV